MAWVTRSERFSWERPRSRENPQDNIGPGSYPQPTSFKEDIRPAYAPFHSTKDLDEVQGLKDPHDLKKEPDFGLDPGCYNPKLPKAYDHGLPKKHVPFTTGAPRASSLNKDYRPGPGDYPVAKQPPSIASCKTMGMPRAEQRPMFKSTSAPSIPRDQQCFGYDEAGDGRLVRQGRKDGVLQLTGRPGDSAGPGQYDVQNMMAVGSARSSFGKIMPLAADKSVRMPDTPGPGHYLVKGMTENEKPIYSAFASQTERGTKYEKNAADMPGPGQYYGPRPMRPSLREQHPELQYFGSTSERFKEFGTSSTSKIGPGQYGVPAHKRKAPLKSGWSQGSRFEENALLQKRAAQLPGPGAYEPSGTDGKTSGPTGTVSILGSTGSLAFGSMEARRGEGSVRKGEERPGPGAYYEGVEEAPDVSRTSDGSSKKPVRRKYRTPSSMFTSNVPKDAMTRQYEKDGQLGPPPGAYSPQAASDVGSVLRMPPRSEGFGSAAPRDKDTKYFTAPGPGWYKPGDITCGKTCGSFNRTAVEGAPASGKPKGLGFESQTKRFQDKSSTKHFPGPGAYKTDPSWIKTTHNIHFGDFA